jgi:methylated-DNA-[protein]-cysteine S-methyltransferase
MGFEIFRIVPFTLSFIEAFPGIFQQNRGGIMSPSQRVSDSATRKQLRSALGGPPAAALARSQARVKKWFAQAAPLIRWDEMNSPLGKLFVAMSDRGLCAVDFGRSEADFLARLAPLARLEKQPAAAAQALAQLREYFTGQRKHFDLPVDLSTLTPFQREVLATACRIAPGQVWSYQKVAQEMSRPKSSRPVGQALAHNPIPIVIPCHRVIASDGRLGGYSGGSGLAAKRWLLRLEGAAL